MNFNQVVLAGNITRDIEVRYTPKGTAVAQTGIAVNRKWTTEGGEQREEVTFCDLTFFGRQAENVAQYMRKGSQMLISGRLKLDQWDDKQSGQKRQKLSVIVENMQFGSSPRDDGGERRETPRGTRPPRPSAPTDAPQSEGDQLPGEEEDIPF